MSVRARDVYDTLATDASDREVCCVWDIVDTGICVVVLSGGSSFISGGLVLEGGLLLGFGMLISAIHARDMWQRMPAPESDTDQVTEVGE